MLLKKVSKAGFGYLKLFLYKLMFGKRLKLKSLKQSVCFDTEILIGKNSRISLGNITCSSNLHLLCSNGEMDIGNVCFNRYCIIACRYKVQIGDNCLFGPNVCIYDHDHIYTVDGVLPSDFKCSEIIIEEGCWIGAGAIILRGTHIGKNSVVEAGTVVRGKIPPNSLVKSIKETRILPTAMFLTRKEISKVTEKTAGQ